MYCIQQHPATHTCTANGALQQARTLIVGERCVSENTPGQSVPHTGATGGLEIHGAAKGHRISSGYRISNSFTQRNRLCSLSVHLLLVPIGAADFHSLSANVANSVVLQRNSNTHFVLLVFCISTRFGRIQWFIQTRLHGSP